MTEAAAVTYVQNMRTQRRTLVARVTHDVSLNPTTKRCMLQQIKRITVVLGDHV